jgi:hypothetical protein
MQNQENATQTIRKRAPWNKAKLTGANLPLRPRRPVTDIAWALGTVVSLNCALAVKIQWVVSDETWARRLPWG